jgi:hypothetical protein
LFEVGTFDLGNLYRLSNPALTSDPAERELLKDI